MLNNLLKWLAAYLAKFRKVETISVTYISNSLITEANFSRTTLRHVAGDLYVLVMNWACNSEVNLSDIISVGQFPSGYSFYTSYATVPSQKGDGTSILVYADGNYIKAYTVKTSTGGAFYRMTLPVIAISGGDY